MAGDQPIQPAVTPATALQDLARLDDVRPAALDPTTWARNIAALRASQPQLAERVQAAAPPAGWCAAMSLDNVPTWRIEPRGAAPAWLDGAALPATRAAAMDLRKAADRNIALATIGSGYEAASLLERTATTQAVFVFEDNLAQVAAVLRIVRLDEAIEAGRFWILPDAASADPLLALLGERAGLLPPGIILHLPGVAPERVTRLQETLRRAAEAIAAVRTSLLDAARARFAAAAACRTGDGAGSIAILSATPDRDAHAASLALAAATSAAGAASEALVLDRPDRVHALWSVERLASLCPSHVLFTDAQAENVATPRGVEIAVWHVSLPDAADVNPGVKRRFAASPRIAQRLRETCPSSDIVPLYWGAWTEDVRPTTGSERLPDGAIVVLGDLPDDSADACGIDQPAHKLLWQALHGTVAARWETRDILYPEALLTAVEREAGVSLRDAATRGRMARQIERRLAPAGVLRKIVESASACGAPLAAIGDGWGAWRTPELISAPASPGRRLPHGWRPVAAILPTCADPFPPAIQAVAQGWPLLIHAPGGTSPDGAFDGMLSTGRDYATFRTGRELLSALRAMRANPTSALERARRAAARIQAEHSWAQRGRALLRALRT